MRKEDDVAGAEVWRICIARSPCGEQPPQAKLLSFYHLSGLSAVVIGQHHCVSNTHKDRSDLIVFTVSFGTRHRDDRSGRLTVEETGEERKIVMLSGSQRLEGADMFRSDIGAQVTIPPALLARSA